MSSVVVADAAAVAAVIAAVVLLYQKHALWPVVVYLSLFSLIFISCKIGFVLYNVSQIFIICMCA